MDTLLALIYSIPPLPIVILGIGATLKYAWKVFYKKDMKNIGALVSTLYMTLVYIFILSPIEFHGQSFVRVGVLLLFIDKNIVFAYDLVSEYKMKNKKKEDGKVYA